MKFFDIREHLRSSLWFIPSLFVAGAAGLAFVLVQFDRESFETDVLFAGGADGARNFLSVIASSMITFTGLVFSITIVVLQLASQQFSPRVLRSFLRDRHSQVAMGVFTATFTYALVVLREVRSPDSPGGEFVPSLAVTVAFLFVIGSLFVSLTTSTTSPTRSGSAPSHWPSHPRLGKRSAPSMTAIPSRLPSQSQGARTYEDSRRVRGGSCKASTARS